MSQPSRPADTSPPSAPPSRGIPWRPILLIAAVAAVMVLAWTFDIGAKIRALQGWIAGLGAWGPLVFVLLYALASLLALPGVAMTALAGGLFGSLWGIVAVSCGATLGAALAFLAARYIARSSIEAWLGHNPKFQRLDAMVERQGAIVVAVTRLVPLFPFNLLNFGFGLTRVPFGTYVLYSWLCMLPGTVLYVVGFDALFTGLAQGKVPWALVAVTAAMAGLLVLIVRRARRLLAPGAAEAPPPPDAPAANQE
ncbi:MAG: TVP38/TMEM64 family protein [Pseudomonadota bacterium]